MTSELDIERPGALIAYLRATGRIGEDEKPLVRVLSGGVSNRAMLVVRSSGEAWVVKQALDKLRVAVDWFSSPERIHREALGLRWLQVIAPPGATTPLVFEDRVEHILAMEAVPEPHENWKTLLLAGRLEFDHVEQFARLLGTVHQVSGERRAELIAPFGDRGFFESLRVEPYYLYTGAVVPESVAFIEHLVGETRSRQDTIVHGDYSPKNVLVHAGRLVLLDHEVIHLGDPGFDLGFSMTHFLSKAHHLVNLRTQFAQAALLHWATYRETIGEPRWATDLEARAVRHTLGCLLSRVRGRSPLEYLDESERGTQAAAVLALMAAPPHTVAELVHRFVTRIEATERRRGCAAT